MLKNFLQSWADTLSGGDRSDESTRDYAYHQAKVAKAVLDNGGSVYKAWQASGDALHLSPQEIARMYGEAAGNAAYDLQHMAAKGKR